jgi:hypothetical protein
MKTNNITTKENKEFLIRELTEDKFVKMTNKGQNEIYIFDYHQAPELMLEVARLREITFRQAGGGTGNSLDIDKFDVQQHPYKQLIVWDPKDKEIVGGYRFAFVSEVVQNSNDLNSISFYKYFSLSADFIENYLPWSIELGRAFVQPKYQSRFRKSKSLFALDNLWDGLGALIFRYPNVRYFYGKVTLYQHFPGSARNLLLEFLYNHFGETGLISPYNPMSFSFPQDRIHAAKDVETIEKNYTLLSRKLRSIGVIIPPMVNAYVKLSSSMKVMGTLHDKEFGEVDETAVLITIADIYPHKIERHITHRYESPKMKAAC